MGYDKITISGQICTGKTTLYRALEKHLGWPTFSTGQFFRDYAAKHQLDLEAAQEQNDKITKKVDNQVRHLLKTKKQIIVEGWLAGLMAAGVTNVLRILLVCQNNKRGQRFAQRENVKTKEAVKRVKERDSSWLTQIKKIYDRDDIFDYCHYDLVIDTTKLTPIQILKKVLKKLN